MGNNPLAEALKCIPDRASTPPAVVTKAEAAQPDDDVQLSQIVSSVNDVRRELLEITTKLKDGITSAKIDFNRETQRMSTAEANRNSQTNALNIRIDQLEAAAHRFDELIAKASQKLSAVSISADSATQDAEMNKYTISSVSGSVDILKSEVEQLQIIQKKIGKKSLTIRWISVLGMLSLVGIFSIYRIVSLPNLSNLERSQTEHTEAIQRIIQHLNNQ